MSAKRNFSELRSAIDASPARRARVEEYKRGALAAVALAELREGRELRQTDIAATLGVSQANVSRLEREEDVYVSTLRKYVSALGGVLEVSAVFPDQKVSLAGFSSSAPRGGSARTRSAKGGADMAKSRKTSAKAAKVASKVLKDGRTGKASKTTAGSALSQRAPKRSK